MVNDVAPDSEFENRLTRMTEKVAQGPTRAYGAFRQLIDRANGDRLADHLEAERAAFLDMTRPRILPKACRRFWPNGRQGFAAADACTNTARLRPLCLARYRALSAETMMS